MAALLQPFASGELEVHALHRVQLTRAFFELEPEVEVLDLGGAGSQRLRGAAHERPEPERPRAEVRDAQARVKGVL